MPQVIDRVGECGLNFEIYDDGDCVLTNSPGGFVQLSAALIERQKLLRQRGREGEMGVVHKLRQSATLGEPDDDTIDTVER